MNLDEAQQERNELKSNWLRSDDNKIDITEDYLAQKGIRYDMLYDTGLHNRYRRSLFIDLYNCNEDGIWDYLTDNLDYYIRQKGKK